MTFESTLKRIKAGGALPAVTDAVANVIWGVLELGKNIIFFGIILTAVVVSLIIAIWEAIRQ